jgi:hypothetical protein
VARRAGTDAASSAPAGRFLLLIVKRKVCSEKKAGQKWQVLLILNSDGAEFRRTIGGKDSLVACRLDLHNRTFNHGEIHVTMQTKARG